MADVEWTGMDNWIVVICVAAAAAAAAAMYSCWKRFGVHTNTLTATLSVLFTNIGGLDRQ